MRRALPPRLPPLLGRDRRRPGHRLRHPATRRGPPRRAREEEAPPSPSAFLRIGTDDSVTVLLAHSEMGQGIWTTLPMLVAEELQCDWSKIRVEHAPAAPVYVNVAMGMQVTGGSSTTNGEFDRYRQVGRPRPRPSSSAPRPRSGRPTRRSSGSRTGSSSTASDVPPSASSPRRPRRCRSPTPVALKPPEKWTLIGKPTRRLDTPEKITGRAAVRHGRAVPRAPRGDGRPGARVRRAAEVVRCHRGPRDPRRRAGGPGPERRRRRGEAHLGGEARARGAQARLGPGPRGHPRLEPPPRRGPGALAHRRARRARQGKRGRRAGQGRPEGRGRLRGSVPRPRPDGAAQLRGQARRRPLRDLDRHPVPDGAIRPRPPRSPG